MAGRGFSSPGTHPESAGVSHVPRHIVGALRSRPELLVLVVLGVACYALPGRVLGGRPVPVGVAALGASDGATLALLAIGVLVIYRSNGVINFAQAAMGAVSGYLFTRIFFGHEFIRLYGALGGDAGPSPDRAAFSLHVVNFLVAIVVAIAAAPLVGLLVYFVVVRWFERSPAVLVTVVTLGIASLVTHVPGWIDATGIWRSEAERPPLPFDVILFIEPATLHMPDLAAVLMIGVVAIGLVALFRYTAVGVVLRASADNGDRARTLGIAVGAVNSLAWVIGATLSGLAAVLIAARGRELPTAFDAALLVRVLAAVVIARLSSLPMAVVGAIGLGIIEQGLAWNLDDSAVFDGALLALLLTLLLVQRGGTLRADQDAAAASTVAREVRPTPQELRNHPVVRRYAFVGSVIALALVLGLPWLTPPEQTSLATVAMIYAIIGLSLVVLTGWAGQISLGQFALAGIGAYAGAVLSADTGIPAAVAVIAAGLVGAGAAVLIGLPALRLPGLNLAVVTLALALATTSLVLNPKYLGRWIPTSVERPALLGLNTDDDRVFYYVTVTLLLASAVAVRGTRRSRFARYLIAARDNEPAAQAFGVNIVRFRLQAFAVSGFIAAAAGAVFAFQQRGVFAQSYSANAALLQFLVTVMGGLGAVSGPVVAQLFHYLVQLFNIPFLSALAVGAGVVLLLLLYPRGLGGLLFEARDKLLRRIAIRYSIVVPSLLADTLYKRRPRAPLAPRRGAQSPVNLEYSGPEQWDIPTTTGKGVRR